MPCWLRKNEFGGCVFSTIHTVGMDGATEKRSKREKQVIDYYIFQLFVF